MLGELGKLFIAEVRPIAVWNKSTVGEEMRPQFPGIEISGEFEFLIAKHPDGTVLDDCDDVLLRALAGKSVFFREALNGRILDVLGEIGSADFVEVEGDFDSTC